MNNYNETMGKPHVTPAQWEQRRYEIAKDCLAAMVASEANPFVSKTQIDTCVKLANELISVLMKSKVSYGELKLNKELYE